MFTDIDPDSAVVDHFEKFLGVPMVSREVLQADTDRVAYFDACRIAGHLFLDPTTGLRLSGTKKNPRYLYGDELVRLASDRPRHLTMTFDQSLSRGSDAKRQVGQKLSQLTEHGLLGFAYVSHASFIVVGLDGGLVDRARETLLLRSQLPSSRLVLASVLNV